MKKIHSLFIFFIFSLFLSMPAFTVDLYWEYAEPFSSGAGKFPVSAYSDSLSAIAWQEVTPNNDPNVTASGFINIHLAVQEGAGQWVQRGIVAGPYPYSGVEPSVISMVVDNRGRIIITAAAGGSQTEILISENRGISFTRQTLNMGSESSVAPRIFVRADGGYLLFITRGLTESLSIYYSRSSNGTTWTPFELFVPENYMALNFLPTHASAGNRDIVFFQSIVIGLDLALNFQLYYKISEDGGITWTESRQFTTFSDPVMYTSAPASDFDNQRPHLTRYGNNLFLVWERRYSNQPPFIYSAVINSNGEITGEVERVNSAEAYCNNPIGFIIDNVPIVVWFDNRSGANSIILAQQRGLIWENYQLSGISIDASFARPIVSRDGVFIFWQTTVRDAGRIHILAPDRSVISPQITPLNFSASYANRSERPRVSWNIPQDPSGIYGFSYSWSQNPDVRPPQYLMVYNTGNAAAMNLEHIADRDGEWYFSISSHDFAGNWSEPAQIMYYRKTTPPPELTIHEPEFDDNGFLISNTFNMTWDESSDPFIAGYTWNLQYLGENEESNINAPPSIIMGRNTFTNFINRDDGIYAFSVSAIDLAGNIGNPSSIIFRTNKYIPYTIVNYIDAVQDEQGVLTINILGRGFSTNGEITSVILAQEGSPDINAEFTILSDREIGGIRFDDIREGMYSLRLEHSTRGWYTSGVFIRTARTGTVKFGDYTREWRPSWIIDSGKFTLNPAIALAAILIIFCILGITVTIRGISGIIMESAAVKQEALAIITGDFMPKDKKQKAVQIEKKGRGLRFKLASFTIALVLLIIVMVSTPMYILMTNTQRETLLNSLWDRSNVLLDGIASSARSYMPMAVQSMGEQGVLELLYLPGQSAALPEANYITITGYGIGSIHTDHVWATNDPEIGLRIDTAELRSGVSRYSGDLNPLYEELGERLNSAAQIRASDISNSIRALYEEGVALALRTDAEGVRRRDDIQVTITSQEVRLNEILTELSREVYSYPEFSTEGLSSDGNRIYTFVKPIMYRQGADDNFFRGFVSLEVSLDSIIDQIFQGQMILLMTIGIVASLALLIGIAGALILSMLIIGPVKKLVRHIEKIRDTEDKTKLAGVEIKITTKDEIAVLGNTINDMTLGLVRAALAASDLSIGKEIQKKFIPLELDNHGNKLTSGFKKTPNLNFFGYYEGAKGVSGDYFDYRELDGRYYAIIKCDVAGKGIPAALIMIQVATMFLNYFKQWKPNAKGMKIEEVVYQINDFIETLGFKGRFAAFTLCLFDSETGIVRFCNAGDNIVHLYKQAEGRKKAITLPTTPATGVLPNFMIESTGGYNVQTVQVDRGDILLLYTDGIEEGKRKFRNKEFKEVLCKEGPADTPHENHLCGQADEEMTPERVNSIIEAVMSKQTYTLKKYHNPEEIEEWQFDFSNCEGRVEDVIMAMVSVEKIFRMYKSPSMGEESRVLVDKKIDEFLKNHFLQYRRYCSHTREYPDNPAYMYYTHVMEDEQYDDLTILGIKRK